MTTILEQYNGYRNTKQLWSGKTSWGIQQFNLEAMPHVALNTVLDSKLRLGKRVERFVSFELRRHKNIEILTENIQIQKDKITLGEIDCLLKQDGTPIHIEIVYKFYLYDPNVGTTEYDHWIGPNRKDSLVDKLTKLKDKQLPLLYRPETATFLKTTLDLEPANLQQQVYFKAQLFIPYNSETVRFNTLNPDCVKGFYIHYNALHQFQDCKFYMPAKTDWLCEVKTQTPWLNFVAFIDKLQPLIDNKTAPLCWMKSPKGLLSKCFVVWWT